MRIALSGPSGSGKTTLVHYLEKKYNLPWLNGSSGGLKKHDQMSYLAAMGLDQGKGHAAIIRSGHQSPIAAGSNQRAILDGRAKLLCTPGDFVTDRSPLDNIVYMLMQCSMYESEDWCQSFIDDALSDFRNLTHLILVTPLDMVEDNGSRIPNRFFQGMVGCIFEKLSYEYGLRINMKGCRILRLPIVDTDLIYRQRLIDDFLDR